MNTLINLALLIALIITCIIFGFQLGLKRGIHIATDCTLLETLSIFYDGLRKLNQKDKFYKILNDSFNIKEIEKTSKKHNYKIDF